MYWFGNHARICKRNTSICQRNAFLGILSASNKSPPSCDSWKLKQLCRKTSGHNHSGWWGFLSARKARRLIGEIDPEARARKGDTDVGNGYTSNVCHWQWLGIKLTVTDSEVTPTWLTTLIHSSTKLLVQLLNSIGRLVYQKPAISLFKSLLRVCYLPVSNLFRLGPWLTSGYYSSRGVWIWQLELALR